MRCGGNAWWFRSDHFSYYYAVALWAAAFSFVRPVLLSILALRAGQLRSQIVPNSRATAGIKDAYSERRGVRR